MTVHNGNNHYAKANKPKKILRGFRLNGPPHPSHMQTGEHPMIGIVGKTQLIKITKSKIRPESAPLYKKGGVKILKLNNSTLFNESINKNNIIKKSPILS